MIWGINGLFLLALFLVVLTVVGYFGLNILDEWRIDRYERNERTRINKTGIVYRYYGKK
jgi:hypothetical protein